ncbi:uncharacterized protein LOC128233555 isoform X2 [Mya arenaria]|uniref:uncharacterized protein LOC128233555 isoform X2 n=1 Tax=Mya arenaria TaxID=6604 RepID=UPI0022DFAA3B|nr:uncharacterized protein LOC128233555 isoform X2 [Mya arenaria]
MFTALVLIAGYDALLFPLNNGQEPEPELLFVCPAPSAPQFGTLKCNYDLFSLHCTSECDAGYLFEDGSHQFTGICDLFVGKAIPNTPNCVKIIPQTSLSQTTVATSSAIVSSATADCVRTLTDCFGRRPGDYAYCDNCRMFATCAGSGFYVRNCPEIAVFDPTVDKCLDYSPNACKA